MELGAKFSEGAVHVVYEHPTDPTKLVKVPKLGVIGSTFEAVSADLSVAKERFGAWLPTTEVQKENGSYIIVQEKIAEARHIKPSDVLVQDIREQVEAILHANRDSMEQDGIGFDFIGLEGSAKCVLSNQKRFRDGILDTAIITPSIRFTQWLNKKNKRLPFPARSLEWWKSEDLTPEITNLVIGARDGISKVFMIDLSLVHAQSPVFKERVRSAVLQWWNRRFLKKNFGLEL